MPAPEMSPHFLKDHMKWAKNTFIVKAHNYCGNHCINFTSGKELAQDEAACMSTCLDKFNQAYNDYQSEKKYFLASVQDLVAQGQDKFVARNI